MICHRLLQVTVNCKPSLFAYPAPITQEASTQVSKVPTAVLSTTARARQKAKKKEAAKAGGSSGERKHAKSPAAKAPKAGPPAHTTLATLSDPKHTPRPKSWAAGERGTLLSSEGFRALSASAASSMGCLRHGGWR